MHLGMFLDLHFGPSLVLKDLVFRWEPANPLGCIKHTTGCSRIRPPMVEDPWVTPILVASLSSNSDVPLPCF